MYCDGNGKNLITSPGYPSNYPDNQDKTFPIKVTAGQVIEILFTDFNLEPQSDQPPQITQSGLAVAVARSELEQTVVWLLSPWQAVPPLDGAGLLQSRVRDFLQLLFPSLTRRISY